MNACAVVLLSIALTPWCDVAMPADGAGGNAALRGNPPRIRPFLAFLFIDGSPFNAPDEERAAYFRVMGAHYASAETAPVSPGFSGLLREYREEALAVNPDVALSFYSTPFRATNPENVSEHSYPPALFEDGDFLCDNPGYLYYNGYAESRRPDSHAFNNFNFPNTPALFQPQYIGERTPEEWAPWGVGAFGWLPFYYFKERDWIMEGSDLLCGPVVKFYDEQVIEFVTQSYIAALEAHPGCTALTFDNAVLGERHHARNDPPGSGWWQGRGVRGHHYEHSPDTQDVQHYWRVLKQALNEHEPQPYKLMLNTGLRSGIYPELFANPDTFERYADLLWTEDDGPRRSDAPAATLALLESYHYLIERGMTVVTDYIRVKPARALSDPRDQETLMFYLSAAMLVYEEGRYLCNLGMCTNAAKEQNCTEENLLRFYPEYFYLPTCAGEPIGPYERPESVRGSAVFEGGLLCRRFEQAIVLLNTNARRIVVPDEDYASLGFATYGAPHALNARQGVIIFSDCECGGLDAGFTRRCSELYFEREPVIALGDANCDGLVDSGDAHAFLLAVNDPAEYARQFPYCTALAACDMDRYCDGSGPVGDGDVDVADFNEWYYFVYRDCERPEADLIGDLNCDGYVDNFDVYPFILALVDAASYVVEYPDCNLLQADVDRDGRVTNWDFDAFVELLAR